MKTVFERCGWSLTAVLVLGLAASPAHADQQGDDLLQLMDTNSAKAEDLQMDYEVLNEIPGKPTRTMRLHVKLKGTKRFTEFLAPGDLKGTRVLSHTRTKMWVYLPAYQKVRRITSHTTDQGFMGTTLTQDDMATTHYGHVYKATRCRSDGQHFVVRGEPREGSSVAYGAAEFKLTSDKKSCVATAAPTASPTALPTASPTRSPTGSPTV